MGCARLEGKTSGWAWLAAGRDAENLPNATPAIRNFQQDRFFPLKSHAFLQFEAGVLR